MSAPGRVVVDANVLSYVLAQSLIGAQYKQLLAGQISCVAGRDVDEANHDLGG